jgi:hypothetical protein
LRKLTVEQTLFARFVLRTQLNNLGILPSSETVESHTKLEAAFKNIWADNADAMSEQYTGTGAMKNDFTRHGCNASTLTVSQELEREA